MERVLSMPVERGLTAPCRRGRRAEWDKARLAMGGGDIEKGRQMLDARMLSRSPVARWADPDEIAQAVDFLCAEQSGLITGAFIPVDGGLHMT